MKRNSTLWLLLITAHFLFSYSVCGFQHVDEPYEPFELASPFYHYGGYGDTIVLKGTLVDKDTTVNCSLTIGKTKVPVLSLGRKSITFVIPDELQSGDISITIADYTYKTNGYIYVKQPADVTTIAGTGEASFADGAGASASFNYPAGMIIGRDKNLYVADVNNRAIRKINLKNNTVSTIQIPAGIGFEHPYMLVEDPYSGSLYVSGKEKGIVKIKTNGEVSMIYTKDEAIRGFILANDWHLLVAVPSQSKIKELDTTGNVTNENKYVGRQYGLIDYVHTNDLFYTFLVSEGDHKYVRVKEVVNFPAVPASFNDYTYSFSGNSDIHLFFGDNYSNQVLDLVRNAGDFSATITGSGESVDRDGFSTAAAFDGIQCIVAESNGAVVYVSTYNPQTHTGNKIRKLSFR